MDNRDSAVLMMNILFPEMARHKYRQTATMAVKHGIFQDHNATRALVDFLHAVSVS